MAARTFCMSTSAQSAATLSASRPEVSDRAGAVFAPRDPGWAPASGAAPELRCAALTPLAAVRARRGACDLSNETTRSPPLATATVSAAAHHHTRAPARAIARRYENG